MGNAIGRYKRLGNRQWHDYRWPDGKIPYKVDPDLLSNRLAATAVKDAIDEWNSKTSIEMTELRPGQTVQDYLYFELSLSHCLSPVGRQGGRQIVGCAITTGSFSADSVMHEIGHSVGLYHEHQRRDRDQHIDITFPTGYRDANYAFIDDKSIAAGPYDYSSIMHYPPVLPDGGSISCTPGSCPTNMGSPGNLSSGDIDTVQFMYSLHYVSVGGVDWEKKAPVAMTSVGAQLYIIEANRLWKADLSTSKAKNTHLKIGSTNWNRPPIAIAGLKSSFRELFVVEGERLHKVDLRTGNDSILSGSTWKGNVVMAAVGDRLFIIEKEQLWEVINYDTGKARKVGRRVWTKPPIAMASVDNRLFVIENKTLYEVDLSTGDYRSLPSSSWVGDIAMTGSRRKLFMIENGFLWSVDDLTNGKAKKIGEGCTKKHPITISYGTNIYILEDGHLYWCEKG